MNLTTEPWIPVTDSNDQARQVSLRQIFAEGEMLQDLAVRPHERVALMRLLICIAQAALDGPADRQTLATCGRELPAAAGRYFDRWQESFDLFHPEKPFLQFSGLSKPPKPLDKKPKKAKAVHEDGEDEEGTAASKMDFALATGNNTTLFDHEAANDEARTFPPNQLALMLITFQCFSPGGRIGVARWRGSDTPGSGSSGHAPCAPSAMLHAFIRRSTLLDGIHANLLSRWSVKKNYAREWGRPVWEQMPESFSDAPAIANATTTYLGRLMPLARAIVLRPDGKGLLLANGLDYPTPPEFPAEPTASIVKKGDDTGHVLVGAGNKAIWRELPSLVVKRLADKGAGGPLVLGELNDDESLDLWVGALITDKASILDTVEGVYAIPARMLNDDGRRTYEKEIEASEQVESKLRNACEAYRQHLELKPQVYPERALAVRRYWTSIEQQLPLLRAYINVPDGTDEAKSALAKWRNGLWKAAYDALTTTCANETPRQLRAYSLARRDLQRSLSKPKENPPNQN